MVQPLIKSDDSTMNHPIVEPILVNLLHKPIVLGRAISVISCEMNLKTTDTIYVLLHQSE